MAYVSTAAVRGKAHYWHRLTVVVVVVVIVVIIINIIAGCLLLGTTV